MSDLFQLEFLSVKHPQFKEVLCRASAEDLERCLKMRTILLQTEKCCRIYAALRRKRREAEKQPVCTDVRTDG